MLRLLGVDADRSGTPIGLGPRDALPAWPHLRLHPLTFEKLELLEDASTSGGQAADHPGAGVRAAQLWLGLARFALASEASREEDTAATPTEPAVIARAIDAHPRGDVYDQVIVAHLLQIAGELKGAGGAEGAALRRRTAKLVGTMQPDTLRRLLEMGGDEGQRRRFVAIAALAVLSLVPLPAVLVAQGAVPRRSRLEGKWQARGPDEAIHYIMVRGDSSAQFGDQMARWRVVGDSLWLTLGDGVWMVYGMRLEGSGGGGTSGSGCRAVTSSNR